MKMPEIEEFMIFEDDNGKTGVIIEGSNTYRWWKCYRGNGSGGQIFNIEDNHSDSILRLYKCNRDKYTKYCALKFMQGDYILNDYNYDYECVYDKTIKKEPVINNYTINISVSNNDNSENVMKKIVQEIKNLGANI